MRRQWGEWGKQRDSDTEVATKYQAKSQGEPSGRAQYKHVFFWDKVLSLVWLYTNFAFNSVTKRNVLNGKTILRKFWIVSCNLLVAFEVLKSILLMLNVILWSQIYPLHPSDTQHFCKYLHWNCKNSQKALRMKCWYFEQEADRRRRCRSWLMNYEAQGRYLATLSRLWWLDERSEGNIGENNVTIPRNEDWPVLRCTAEPRPVWGRRGRDKERGRKLNFLLSTGL